MHILIIGAGFGGVCLANGLQNEAGIQISVFERHSSPDHELAGYGLHVGVDGLRALKHCLDEQSYRRFMETTTPAGSKWAFRDTALNLLALRDDAKISGKTESEVERRASHRFEFRDILLKGLRKTGGNVPVVHWGKEFSQYERLDDGSVRVYFADGTTAEGDVLIGADGAKSVVREQRLPEYQREDLGMVIVCGRYQLDETREKDLPPLMTDGSLNNIVPMGKGWLFIASFPSRAEELRKENYTLWAYVIPKSQTPTNAKAMSPTKLRDISLAGVRKWSPSLETVIRDADLTTVAPIVLRSMPHLSEWESNNITVLGDAIHNMTPMAGVGANIALRDAQTLADLLIEAHRGEMTAVEAISIYEAKMRQYANAAVALSKQIAQGASSDSRLERLMFHGVLRLAQASPFVMRSTIGRGALEE